MWDIIKKKWAKIWNLRFFDKWIKLTIRFIHYEHFYFVVIFISAGLFLIYCIKSIYGDAVAAGSCYIIGLSIKVVWASFRIMINAEEKRNIAKQSKTDVFCLMYKEMINTLKDANGHKEVCSFMLDKFKTSFNGLITYGPETITEEMKNLSDKINRLDSTDSKFINDLEDIEANLEEIITKISSNFKNEE